MLFAGVDGGQSGSRAVLADEHGAIRARVHGRALFVKDGGDVLVAELTALLRHARAQADVPPDQTLRAVVAGLSGQDEEERMNEGALNAVMARLVHDAEIAHAGALAGHQGIVVAAGSGSVAFGTDRAGHRIRHGGWGPLFGDEGGALWIGRRGVARAMRAEDEGAPTGLAASACSLFGARSLRSLQRAALSGAIAPEELGGFAPQVLALAQGGDAVAASVMGEAVDALCDLASSVDRALDRERGRAVSFAGKVFENSALRDAWRERVAVALDAPRVLSPRAEPVMGAIVLAYRDAGIDVPQRIFRSVP